MGNKLLKLSILSILVILITAVASLGQGPIIDVWYGDSQKFGHLGNPQNWVNILGNVSDPDGIKQINYSLNGRDEVVLSIGPDGRRLQRKGDFNIDLSSADLINGVNELLITAIDSLDETSNATVSVEYTEGEYWENNYQFQWDTVSNIQNVVQVVDGKWELTANGIRTVETGYDRLIAIGDTSWTNYQIEIPITVHDIEAPISEFGGNDFGLGLILRWTGHTDSPPATAGWQPKSGYLPLGEIGWFNWPESNISNTQLNFLNTTSENRNPFTVENGKTYIFKFQVVTTPFVGHSYKMKVWEDGTTEPMDWFLENTRDYTELSFGSLLFVAHHVDATFANPSIKKLSEGFVLEPDFTTKINEANSLTVTFDASTSFDNNNNINSYLWDFGNGINDSGEIVIHSFQQTGVYNVTLEIIDDDGRSASTSRNIYLNEDGIILNSDDFNSKTIDASKWEFINPKMDGEYSISGYNSGNSLLKIDVPGDISHDIWTSGNESIRLMQYTVNEDFEIETKFESIPTQTFQMQGVLVEQDSVNFIRFDFFSENKNLNAFSAIFENGSPSVKYNALVSNETDTIIQVLR
jgi:hypothetical protein